MASSINFYVVSAVFLVIIGCLPCKSNDCTRPNIYRCHSDNLIMPEECINYAKKIECLNEISNCTDDTLVEVLALEMKSAKEQQASCPGIPDGVCYQNILLNDCGRIPYVMVKYGRDEAAKKETCDDFIGKASHMKNCTEDVRTKCVSEGVFRIIDLHIQRLDETLESCAGFYNTTSA